MAKPQPQTAAKQTRHLTKPLAMEDSLQPRVFVSLGVLACCFMAAAGIWGSIGQMRGTIVATGQVTLVGAMLRAQNREAGRITKILVKEGQIIEKGQPLIHLKPSAITEKLKKLHVRQAYLVLQIERLEAALQNRQFKFGPYARQYSRQARRQREILSQNRAHNTRKSAALVVKIKHHDREIDALTKLTADLAGQVDQQAKRLKARRDFNRKSIGFKNIVSETRRIYKKIHGDLLDTRGRLKSELKALNEARIAKLEFDATVRKKWFEEREDIKRKLVRLNPEIALLETREERSYVLAPVRGVVQELNPKSGDFIETGTVIAKIMPLNQKVSAEVMLAPDQIQHLKIGQHAQVKISAFDASHLGMIEGVIGRISTPLSQGRTGGSFYKVFVALRRNYIKRASQNHMIRPGMRVSVQFVTSAQSLASYLLIPANKSAKIAFAGQ